MPTTTLFPTSSIGSDSTPKRWLETARTVHEDALHHSAGAGDKRSGARRPRRAFEVGFPLLRDDLSTLDLSAHIVHYGPPGDSPLCAVRFDAHATVEESAALAALAACKHAVAGIPHGGASGALLVDPGALSQLERESAARRLARALRAEPNLDGTTLAPQAELDEPCALWLAEELRTRQVETTSTARAGLSAVTPQRGGLGEAVRIVVEEALRGRNLVLRGARVSIHGYGELGRQTATALAQARARIVAVTDGPTCFYHPNGIDPAILPALSAARGPVRVEGMLTLPASTVFSAPCEVLVLTRSAPKLTPTTAKRVGAKAIIEADDALLPPAADALLARNRVTVVPDLLGALGAPILHHLAWRQRQRAEKWSKRQVFDELAALLRETYWMVEEASYKSDVGLRRAAHRVAAESIVRAAG